MYGKNWYKNLNKSKLTPPSWVFGVVWPILYILLSVFFILLLKDEKCKGMCNPLILFGIQILLNLLLKHPHGQDLLLTPLRQLITY